MTIKDNPNLILTLTMHADEEEELEWMLKEVTKQVRSGAVAGQGGGCSCSYYYDVAMQTRAAELPLEQKSDTQPACSNCRKEFTSSCPSLRKELCDYYERRVS